ncbi:hypothetical protein BDW59DRAFT_74951 [Aspergillus cavernicola]|uniref:Secreted protein n=1 Tax=Aspergillus cavernicola TaxID=176166 RepID=A0ABR4IE95_9EURO
MRTSETRRNKTVTFCLWLQPVTVLFFTLFEACLNLHRSSYPFLVKFSRVSQCGILEPCKPLELASSPDGSFRRDAWRSCCHSSSVILNPLFIYLGANLRNQCSLGGFLSFLLVFALSSFAKPRNG